MPVPCLRRSPTAASARSPPSVDVSPSTGTSSRPPPQVRATRGREMKRNTIRRTTLGIFAAVALALAAGLGVAAAAPGVTPSTFSATLNPGDSVVVPKVVHTQPIPPKPDIYLLADSTGSMGPA